jgi:hypothetical protein
MERQRHFQARDPLTAEINISSLQTTEKALITPKQLEIDGKFYGTRIENHAWLFYLLVTSFPVSNAPKRLESIIRHIGRTKNA